MKTTTLQSNNSTNRLSGPLALLFIPLALACFALAPQARATCQEGCDINANTFLGDGALVNNTVGQSNTAIGAEALQSNTTGSFNTANGEAALFTNTEGFYNTATGVNALSSNTTGSENTAIGLDALLGNTEGVYNTATGSEALASNTTGGANTATGKNALHANTTGSNNTANGTSALQNNTTGINNTAIGVGALPNNTTGSSNIALGVDAGSRLTTGANNIDIANNGVAGEGRTIRIGATVTHRRTFVAGISGVTVAGGVGVIVDTNGQLGTVVSSARFKDAIKPMDKASEAILALKPVTFHYKPELDPEGIRQFGLVAEDVAKVNPDLVARDEQGKPYTVRYEAVNAMLLNEFLKEHRAFVEGQRKVEEQDCTLQEQATMIARQQKQIDALTAGLQKVSAQAELSKSATQTVLNDQ
jgi:hypothetical protein